MGGLVDDFRTYYTTSKRNENVILATLLLEKNFNGIEYSYV